MAYRTSTSLDRARELRNDPTDAERHLWRFLRGRALGGDRFRRQEPIGPYFVDFFCPAAKVAVELDGGGHAEPDRANRDLSRDAFLRGEGIEVVRIWNNDAVNNTDGVLEHILSRLRANRPTP
jgi:very-short-patch-repair endonuclease